MANIRNCWFMNRKQWKLYYRWIWLDNYYWIQVAFALYYKANDEDDTVTMPIIETYNELLNYAQSSTILLENHLWPICWKELWPIVLQPLVNNNNNRIMQQHIWSRNDHQTTIIIELYRLVRFVSIVVERWRLQRQQRQRPPPQAQLHQHWNVPMEVEIEVRLVQPVVWKWWDGNVQIVE